jgi:hypothetical protein
VEWYRQDISDSFITALWQSYQQSSSREEGGTGEVNDEFCLTKYLFNTSKDFLICRKLLRHLADGFTFIPKAGVLHILSTLKISRLRPTLNLAYLGSNGKHADHCTTEDDNIPRLHYMLPVHISSVTYCNMFARSLFTMEVYYTQKLNTQHLITVHNSSRLLTQV